MRFAVPITVALIVLTACVGPIAAQQTTTDCGTMDDGMATETTAMMGNESMNSMNATTTAMMSETTETMDNEPMGNESMDSTNATTQMMGNESMATTETMAEETTTCPNGGMGDGMDDTTSEMGDSMSDTTTESMNDQSMSDATDTPDSGSSAFAPGFGVGAAVVALLGALLLARR